MNDISVDGKDGGQGSCASDNTSNYPTNLDMPRVVTDPEKRRILYEQFLRCLDREENLIHYRMSWGLLWNAAGFGAVYGLPKSGFSASTEIIFSVVVALSGSIVSIMSFIGISAAHRQTKYLIPALDDINTQPMLGCRLTQYVLGLPSANSRR
jgi:hypothetical protein